MVRRMTVCHAVEGKEKESCLGKLSREVVEKGISGLHIFAVKERERERESESRQSRHFFLVFGLVQLLCISLLLI